MPKRPDNHVIVVFGSTGDLAKRKLFPGLYRLSKAEFGPGEMRIIGSGRHSPGSDEDFRKHVRDALDQFVEEGVDDVAWKKFSEHLQFVTSSADDGADLAAAIAKTESAMTTPVRRLLFLAVPPNAMESMVKMIGESGAVDGGRLVIEKPFGVNLETAKSLNATLDNAIGEDNVFRIDHFLGKEAAQNILAFRFANGLFEPTWNSDHIAYVQIDVPETLDLEGRAGFYEGTGAFRDMVVTHLSQLLGFVAMEPPSAFTADALHERKLEVFMALKTLDPDEVVFGQYEGYRAQKAVNPNSQVETMVALKAWVDSPRWQGVPFLLRTGKAMAEGRRTVTVGFKDPPMQVFKCEISRPNEVVFEISDEPQVTVSLRAKVPGPAMDLQNASLQLDFADAFTATPLEAYERLLLDVMNGDHTLFASADEVERLWVVAEPVLEAEPNPLAYPRGSWGPQAAIDLAKPEGWHLSDHNH